jgi:phenazine biosynthesis protein phzE
VHALRGPGFAGVQFHPESVLSVGGAAVVRELLDRSAAVGTTTFSGRRRTV